MNKLTAKQYKANAMEEQAEASEELITNLTESHTCQIEILIKSTTETMKEMMALVNWKTDPLRTTMKRQKGEKGNMSRKMQNVHQRTNL